MGVFTALGRMAAWTAAQALLFVATYQLAWHGVRCLRGPPRRDIAFGIGLHYGVYLLLLLATANGVARVLCSRKRTQWGVTLACLGIWTAYWFPGLSSTPYRTSLVLALGAGALFACHFPVRAVAARIGRPGRNSGHEA